MPFLNPLEVRYSGNHQEMLDQFGMIAFDRQMTLQECIRSKPWNFEIDSGVITFGNDIRAEAQLIGSYSQSDGSWMWAWANEESQFPPELLKLCNRMKEIGRENGIDQFTVPLIETDERLGHFFSMIASGLFGASAYYPADTGNGFLFTAISSPEIDAFAAAEPECILTRFPQFIMSFPVRHRISLYHYLTAKGFEVKEEGIKLTGIKGSNYVFAEFDDQDRLTSLNGNIAKSQATAEPKKKKWWFF